MSAKAPADTPLAVEVEVEEMPRWRRKMAVRVPAEVVEGARKRYAREVAKKTRIKGFRPGKAPVEMVEKRYADEIDHEVMEDMVRAGYEAGLAQTGLDPVGAPEFAEVRRAEDGGVEFSVEVDVRPEIDLGRATGFRIERPGRAIGDEDTERVIDRLRHERAEWPDVERSAAIGDRVAFDSVPLAEDGAPIDAERIANHVVELGTSTLVPDFESGLVGRSPNEEATIDVTFPDDHPNPALRGQARRFGIRVHAVRERVLPPLDDELARAVGDFADLAALRERIRSNLEQEVAEQSEREVNEALIDEIISANQIDLPESLIERYLTSMMSDQGGPLGRVPEARQADLREILRPGAERALKRYYILRRLAETEGLDAPDADLEAAIAERARESGADPSELRRRLERAGDLEDLRLHLTMERVFAWLRENSQITEV